MSGFSDLKLRRLMHDLHAGLPYTDLQLVKDPYDSNKFFFTACVFPGHEEEAKLLLTAHMKSLIARLEADFGVQL